LLTLNALTAASRLVVVTEASFLALQGTDELLETHELVRAHYNAELELAGVIVNRVERTVEHRERVVEIERYFGADLVWQPLLPKRTAVQDATRRGVPVGELTRELASAFGTLARGHGGAACRPLSVARRWAQGRSEGRTRLPSGERRAQREPSPGGYRWSGHAEARR
jgi:hypothetical protein